MLISELTGESDPAVSAFAQEIAQNMPTSPLAILFYGSVLRQRDPNGILDLYIITETSTSLTCGALERMANHVLPPNVYYLEYKHDDHTLRAKVAVLSLPQFLSRSTLQSVDTTIWARFCQPVRLVWVHDPHAADRVLEALQRCVVTAACWAALLGPYSGTAADYWHALFQRTYKAELRVEKNKRSRDLLAGHEDRYRHMLKAAWQHAGIEVSVIGETYQPCLSQRARHKAHQRWERIQTMGRPLNVTRLLKAAFTFKGGVSYLLWKIQRHTGKDIQVSDFERKHPLLGLPLLLWHLRSLISTSERS